MPSTLGHIASSETGFPSTIPSSGLTFWYDADDPSTLTLSGANITQWRDKSGNGRHLTVANGTPTFSTGTIKAARGSVDLASGAFFSVEYGANDKPFSVFIVIKHTGAATYRSIIGCYNNNGLEWRISSGQKQSVVKQYVVEIGVSTTSIPANVAAIIGITYSAVGSLAFRLNSTADNTVSNDQAFSAATPQTRIGEALGEPMTGSYGEVMKYNRVLTGPEITTIESYLNTKWM